MSSVLPMEWNGKPPLQWHLENLVMVNASNENPKKLQAIYWEMDGEKGLDSGSFNSSGIGSGSGSGGSGSDLGLASLSKSSKSPSINSSSIGEVKASNFSLRASNSISGERSKVKPSGTSAAPEGSICSSEPLLSLKLGKRAYFEDVYAGSTTKTTSISSTAPSSSVTPPKRSKSHAVGGPHCQVGGCNLDLSSAKDYHKKHRVCEEHSKCPKVMVNGLERRFCQQCSRFHGLSEFDEKKRSCRRRLSDHNARRRKPQQDLNSAKLPPTLYGGRQDTSYVWNRSPLVHGTGTNTDLTWESASSSRFTITKEYVSKPAKIGNISSHQHIPGNGLTSSITMLHGCSNGFLPSKCEVAEDVTNQGLEESIVPSNADATQDLHRALSLLSTNTWGSCDTKHVSLQHPLHKNPTTIPPSHVMPPAWSSELWRTEQQPADSQVTDVTPQSDGSSYYQEFQLLRGPYETDFYSDHLN